MRKKFEIGEEVFFRKVYGESVLVRRAVIDAVQVLRDGSVEYLLKNETQQLYVKPEEIFTNQDKAVKGRE